MEAVNQLRSTLGEDHPSTVAVVANLASFDEERAAPAPFSRANDWMARDDEITDEEWPRRPLGSSVEVDMDNQTNAERLQPALAMSVVDGNDNDEFGSFKATSIEPDDSRETDEERIQRVLAMSMMDENGCEKFVASKAGRPIVMAVFIVSWLTRVARLQAARSEGVTKLGHKME